MPWVLLALQIVLSATMALAAAGKLLQSDEFVAALRLSHLPEGVVGPLMVAVPALELALALALVLAPPSVLPTVMGATSALLAAFTLWMGWVRARRLRVRCGCFGAGGGEVGPATIGRNGVLLLLALAGLAISGRVASPLPGPSLPAVVAATSIAVWLALLLALRQTWPHLLVTFERYQARQRSVGGE